MASRRKGRSAFPLIVLLLLTIGLLCGAGYMSYKFVKADSYVKINAVVVDHDSSNFRYEDGLRRYDYKDVIEYTVDGTTYRIVSDFTTVAEYPPNNIGATRTVYYNPDNPKEYLLKNSSTLIMVILYITSAACILAMAYELSRILKRRRLIKESQSEQE